MLMKDADGRWQNRIWATVGAGLRRRSRATAMAPRISGAAARSAPKGAGAMLKARIGSAAFALRGYDVNNLGRSDELLEHPAYGPVVREVLAEASAISARALGRDIDLAGY